MQHLVKCCLRAAFLSADLELPAKGTHALRAPCRYGALVRRFTAHRYSATAGDALRSQSPTQLYSHQRLHRVSVAAGACAGHTGSRWCWVLSSSWIGSYSTSCLSTLRQKRHRGPTGLCCCPEGISSGPKLSKSVRLRQAAYSKFRSDKAYPFG
jgi:hypothetical protein